MEEYCIGKDKFVTNESYNWYVPNGKVPAEITYCEWCYHNGCFNQEDVYNERTTWPANCDCPKEHPTLTKKVKKAKNLFYNGSLQCPECYFNRFMSTGIPTAYASEGKCVHCGGYVHSRSYKSCVACCVIKNMCFDCNQQFTSGDEYFNKFWDKFSPDRNSCNVDDSSGRLLFVLYRLKGLSNKQVMDAVIEETLYMDPMSKDEKKKKYEDESSRAFMKNVLKYDDAKIEEEIAKRNAMMDKIKKEMEDEELERQQKKKSKKQDQSDNNLAVTAPQQQQASGFTQKMRSWL